MRNPFWKRLFTTIKLWYKKRELRKVVEFANKTEAATGRKILIVNVEGELKAMYKTDFKKVWNKSGSFLKKHTIQEWENRSDQYYQCHEDLKPENKYINSIK